MPLWNPWYRNRTHCLGRNPYKGVSGTKQTHTSMEHLQRGVWDKANPHLYGTPTKGCLGQNKPTPLWNPYKGVSGTKQTHTSMEPLQRTVWDKANPHLYGTPTKGSLGQSKPTPLWNLWYRNRSQCLQLLL
jgi:signal recognition particle receptor subunit beta